MPTKPTKTYTWDTNQTNTRQPSVSLLADGYAENDYPAYQTLNYVFNSLGQWAGYFETATDNIGSISSTTDVSINIDTDNNSTTNKVLITHDGSTEIFALDESANLRINQATVGTNGTATVAIKTGVSPTTQPTDVVQLYSEDFAAGDARLQIKTESGGTISVGNNAIRNVNSDGTLTVASEKHITLDIDSDNDGTDGLLTVRANGSTTALTVTEAGLVTATGNVIGSNITATNSTDLIDSQYIISLRNRLPTQVGSAFALTGSPTVPSITALTATRIAYIDGTNDSLRAYDWNGSTWSLVGSGLSVTSVNPAIAALNSTDIAWADSTADEIRTYRFNGSTWSQVGSSLSIAGVSGVTAITAMSSTRVALSDDGTDTMQAYDWNGSTWSAVGSSVALDPNNVIYITALNSTDVLCNDRGFGMRRYRFDGSSWSDIIVTAAGGPSTAMSVLSSATFAVSSKQNTTMGVEIYAWDGYRAKRISNTINIPASGTISVSSICALSKYAMAIATTANIYYFDVSFNNINTISYGPVIFR